MSCTLVTVRSEGDAGRVPNQPDESGVSGEAVDGTRMSSKPEMLAAAE